MALYASHASLHNINMNVLCWEAESERYAWEAHSDATCEH